MFPLMVLGFTIRKSASCEAIFLGQTKTECGGPRGAPSSGSQQEMRCPFIVQLPRARLGSGRLFSIASHTACTWEEATCGLCAPGDVIYLLPCEAPRSVLWFPVNRLGAPGGDARTDDSFANPAPSEVRTQGTASSGSGTASSGSGTLAVRATGQVVGGTQPEGPRLDQTLSPSHCGSARAT